MLPILEWDPCNMLLFWFQSTTFRKFMFHGVKHVRHDYLLILRYILILLIQWSTYCFLFRKLYTDFVDDEVYSIFIAVCVYTPSCVCIYFLQREKIYILKFQLRIRHYYRIYSNFIWLYTFFVTKILFIQKKYVSQAVYILALLQEKHHAHVTQICTVHISVSN